MTEPCKYHDLLMPKEHCSCDSDNQVTISKTEYKTLLEESAHLAFLHARGVDNWHGYAYPPERDDYDSDEEYQEAFDKASEVY